MELHLGHKLNYSESMTKTTDNSFKWHFICHHMMLHHQKHQEKL